MENSNLRGAASYAMGKFGPQPAEGELNDLVDQLLTIPTRVDELLKSSCKAAAVKSLIRVKPHYPEVEVIDLHGSTRCGSSRIRDCYCVCTNVMHV
jgi:hypothetical protein